MPYNPDIHHRRSIRLDGYDYTQDGAYYITICAHQRENIFGTVENETMHPDIFGQIVVDCWNNIPAHFPHIELDMFVVMPNHVHGIIVIDQAMHSVGATHVSPLPPRPLDGNPRGPKRRSIGAIVGSFKAAVSKRINVLRNNPGAPVWQRDYYEHIIRTETSLNEIREYILYNPARWTDDKLYMA